MFIRVVLGLLLTVSLTSGEILQQGWWKQTVFYQIYPRSFMDSDNDGIGDLKGITSKLEHFVESGVEAIWLSPINRSPMVDFGYDISDFKDIDKIFGTIEDFQDLLARAKKLGLKVILDLVPNHTSNEHYWFNQSDYSIGKYKDYYVWKDGKDGDKGKIPPNNWISVFGGPAWTFSKIRRQWYLHQFEYRQPDLNYSNPHVQREMKEIMIYWLDKGVDGFRVDAVPHLFETNYTMDEPSSNIPGIGKDDYNSLEHTLTKDQPETYKLVQSWRDILDEHADRYNESEKVMMTEAYASLNNTVKFYHYGSHIPFNFNFIMNVDSNSNATIFKEIIDDWMRAKPKDGVPNWVMGNHDRNRTASRFSGRPDQMTMLAMILPGVAVTYYGEEIGMLNKNDISWEDTKDPQGCNAGREKYKSRSRDPARTPFQWNNKLNAGFSNGTPWLPVHENYTTLNLELQKTSNHMSHYKIYQTLTNLRKTSKALKFGSLTTKVLNDVLCVVRNTSDEAVTLLINLPSNKTENERKIDLTEVLAGYQDGVVKVTSLNSGINLNHKFKLNNVTVPARASIVLYSNSSAVSFQTILLLAAFLIMLCK